MGIEEQATDMGTWNADATRMPARMHSEYLRQIFLNNELAQGQYKIGGRPAAISAFTASATQSNRFTLVAKPLVTISHYETPLHLATTYDGWIDRRMIGFYERYGFAQVDPADLPGTFPRMAVDTRFYSLTL